MQLVEPRLSERVQSRQVQREQPLLTLLRWASFPSYLRPAQIGKPRSPHLEQVVVVRGLQQRRATEFLVLPASARVPRPLLADGLPQQHALL